MRARRKLQPILLSTAARVWGKDPLTCPMTAHALSFASWFARIFLMLDWEEERGSSSASMVRKRALAGLPLPDGRRTRLIVDKTASRVAALFR
jgi:hypothetical protein